VIRKRKNLATAGVVRDSPLTANSRDQFPNADFPILICTMPIWITSGSR
jgi:hypothetical protein